MRFSLLETMSKYVGSSAENVRYETWGGRIANDSTNLIDISCCIECRSQPRTSSGPHFARAINTVDHNNQLLEWNGPNPALPFENMLRSIKVSDHSDGCRRAGFCSKTVLQTSNSL